MAIKNLVDEFIQHSPEFYSDTGLQSVDSKHTDILNEAYKQFGDSNLYDQMNFRDWKEQTDYGVPAQLSINNIKQSGLWHTFVKYAYRKLFKYGEERSLRSTILDDMEIIKMVGASDLLDDNPVHLTPGAKKFFIVDGVTVNIRWLRYVYLLKRILDLEVLTNESVWLDVGSFYGGLQGLVRKYSPKTRIVMVDFHHQLCRSFIYLSKMYPDATHIFPDQVQQYSNFREMPQGAIVYVPVSDYEKLPAQSVDLFSNFFSFGEMKKDFFKIYTNSKIFKESENAYLVNRFVSAPFFEKTYDSELSILDYFNSSKSLEYFDVFPMHHYMLVRRDLFGRKGYRNISSSYFEMVLST